MGTLISPKKEIIILEKRCEDVLKRYISKRLLDPSDSNNHVSIDMCSSEYENEWINTVSKMIKNVNFKCYLPENNIKSLKLLSSVVLKQVVIEGYRNLNEIGIKLDKICKYSWNKLSNNATKNTSTPLKAKGVIKKHSECCIPEVSEFQQFVIKYQGHYGNWEEFDHLTFLKLSKKYKGEENKPKLIEELLQVLFGQTRQTIELHIKWFQDYTSKKKDMKDALSRWRKEKKMQKALLNEESINSNLPSDKFKEDERKMVKNSIEIWKKKCQESKEQEDLRREKELLDQKQRELKWMEKQRELKEELEKRRIKIEEEERLLRESQERKKAEELKEKRLLANKEVEKFCHKDFEKIKDKERQKEIREMEKKLKEIKLEMLKKKLAIEVPSDPDRIYKPTKSWLVHSSTKKIRPISSITKANYILTLHQIKHRSMSKRRNSVR